MARAEAQAARVRVGFARLLGDDDPGRIALGQNTHELFCRLLSALPLRTRPRVVTTDGEFHSVRRQLARLAEEGLQVAQVPTAPVATLAERLAAALDDSTALAVVSAVLFRSAEIVPDLGALAQACARRGVELLVDAYHALNVVPFALDEQGLAPAWVTGGGYKYCQLGEGNAFLRLPPGRRPRPVFTGWFAAPQGLDGLLEDAPAGAPDGAPAAPPAVDPEATAAAAPPAADPEATAAAAPPVADPNAGAGALAGAGAPAAAKPAPVGYADGPACFAGATYDPTAHYRAAAVFDFFVERGLTPTALRAISQHQVGLLQQRFDALDVDPTLLRRRPDVPLQARGGFLVLRSPAAAQIRDRLRDRGVHVDSRGDALRLGPAPYLSDAQLHQAMDALEAVVREW